MLRRVASWWRSLVRRPATSTATPVCRKCGRPSAVLDYHASRDGVGTDYYYCDPCSRRTLWIPNPTRQGAIDPPVNGAAEVRVEVERVLFFFGSDWQMLVLSECAGPRRLSFITGYCEAVAIWCALKKDPTPRPLTHQAWLDTISAVGVRVESASVLSRRGDTYFAEVRLLCQSSLVKIDVRPSDALMIALRAGVPFTFAEGLLAADAAAEPEPA
jgi:bifunctional DNase/RNase